MLIQDGKPECEVTNLNSMVLFLDFDGVLHPLGTAALDENFKLMKNPDLFCWRPILETLLAPYPEVKIIVSSDWRRLFDDEALVVLLGHSLGQRFIGVVNRYDESRAAEILAEATQRRLSHWLAIDDHPSVVRASHAGDARFVACLPHSGISDAAVQHAMNRKLAALRMAAIRT